MSFKRDGDDTALLHNLKMRRVGELLGDNIPDDEATLLSNGRLTCLICSQRPIFDTFAVLAAHRKGKKHRSELGKYLSHKRELEVRRLKDDQKKSLQSEIVKEKKSEYYREHPRQRIPNMSLPKSSTGDSTSVCADIISPTAEVRHYLKNLQRKRALQKTVERCRETYSVPSDSAREVHSEQLLESHSRKSQTPQNIVHPVNPETAETMRKHLELKMSGWLQTADGKWVKDPNVEFDSDEEPPDAPS